MNIKNENNFTERLLINIKGNGVTLPIAIIHSPVIKIQN